MEDKKGIDTQKDMALEKANKEQKQPTVKDEIKGGLIDTAIDVIVDIITS